MAASYAHRYGVTPREVRALLRELHREQRKITTKSGTELLFCTRSVSAREPERATL